MNSPRSVKEKHIVCDIEEMRVGEKSSILGTCQVKRRNLYRSSTDRSHNTVA